MAWHVAEVMPMDEEEIKTEIVQFAAMLAQKIGPDKAAEWLEWLALDVEDLVGFDGREHEGLF